MNTFYAVIDTNVIISSAMSDDSSPRQVYYAVEEGTIKPILNKEILDEYENVLQRPKFHFSDTIVDNILNIFRDNGIFLDKTHPLDAIVPDPKDVVFYAVTLEAREDYEAYLVTGNLKDFPIKPFIVTPHQMIEIINGAEPDLADTFSTTDNDSE